MIVLKAEHCCLLLMVIMAMGTIPAGWESPVDLGLDGMHSAACINALGLACGGVLIPCHPMHHGPMGWHVGQTFPLRTAPLGGGPLPVLRCRCDGHLT